MEDLEENVSSLLASRGVKDLFPVQQATYNAFVEGKELIVKSKTGTGKTLSFLLPLTKLVNDTETTP
jgi:superfamily II DNA/RNA helicase